VTWGLVLGLAAGAYAFKFLGLVVIGSRPLPAALDRCLALVPAAMLTALVVQGTVSTGQDLVIDERLPGIIVAIVLAWRRAPFIVIVTAAAATTAILRQL
jgi:branched-subunit amino acid transport protein